MTDNSTDIEYLKKMVEYLCCVTSGCNPNTNHLYQHYRSLISATARRVYAEDSAMIELSEIEGRKRTILQDFPHLVKE